jgi:hypothetical protein
VRVGADVSALVSFYEGVGFSQKKERSGEDFGSGKFPQSFSSSSLLVKNSEMRPMLRRGCRVGRGAGAALASRQWPAAIPAPELDVSTTRGPRADVTMSTVEGVTPRALAARSALSMAEDASRSSRPALPASAEHGARISPRCRCISHSPGCPCIRRRGRGCRRWSTVAKRKEVDAGLGPANLPTRPRNLLR